MTTILSILEVILFGLTTNSTTLCSCLPKGKIEEAYNKADFVGSANVIQIETESFRDSTRIKELVIAGRAHDTINKRFGWNHVTKIIVTVEKVYKGETTNGTVTIYTGMGGGDCGYSFYEGNKYIIYGSGRGYFGAIDKDQKSSTGKGIYWTSICTRTTMYRESEIEELEKLRK
jgi:hypothetical protein